MRELKGFAKTKLLGPNESETLTFVLKASDLASFDSSQSAWVMDAGEYTIQLGASSEDIRLTEKFSVPKMVVEKCSQALEATKAF